MKDYLYHYTLGMPEHLKVPAYTGKLTYGVHAKHEAERDRYGKIDLPEYFDGKGIVIEVAAQGKNSMLPEKIIKQLYRIPYNAKFDLLMMISADGKVITVWLNSKTDRHSTLNKSKYVLYNNNLKMFRAQNPSLFK